MRPGQRIDGSEGTLGSLSAKNTASLVLQITAPTTERPIIGIGSDHVKERSTAEHGHTCNFSNLLDGAEEHRMEEFERRPG
jgi:hypothetical protein